MFDYLEKLRLKPGHIRERIAYGTAAGTTAVVALGWFLVAVSSGTFSLTPSAIVDAAGAKEFDSAFAGTKDSASSLLGAVGAYKSTSSGITVETQASTTVNAPTPTVLPF